MNITTHQDDDLISHFHVRILDQPEDFQPIQIREYTSRLLISGFLSLFSKGTGFFSFGQDLTDRKFNFLQYEQSKSWTYVCTVYTNLEDPDVSNHHLGIVRMVHNGSSQVLIGLRQTRIILLLKHICMCKTVPVNETIRPSKRTILSDTANVKRFITQSNA